MALAELELHDVRLDWMEASLDSASGCNDSCPPGGVIYDDGKVRTDETSSIYRMLRLVEGANGSEVSPAVPSWNQLREWLQQMDVLRGHVAA